MYQLLEFPPQFGECSICHRHTCGEYTDDSGQKRQLWAHYPIELDKGGNLVIGYQCVQALSEDIGISKRVVEKVVHVPPTDDQVLNVFAQASQGFMWNGPVSVEAKIEPVQTGSATTQTNKKRTAK